MELEVDKNYINELWPRDDHRRVTELHSVPQQEVVKESLTKKESVKSASCFIIATDGLYDEAWLRYLLDDLLLFSAPILGRPGLSPHLHSAENVCPYILLTLMQVFAVTQE
ncbi:hypothetical protein AVEN_79788-1 [Araneus ventricosus]|uniref:Uncharacterized protein n=1 Tax=Araneus ventricosus TaxID=182803 RepID=A0A4Y2G227_ARAVE|nr:hypothetical protein AVEN_79788-1 [Araneus ventricosus]